MCGDETAGAEAFEAGLAEAAASRRTLLKVGGSGLLFSAAAGAAVAAGVGPGAGTAAAARAKRAYVLVVDGCRPDEIDSGLMPTLKALRDGGKRFPRASSMPIMETIPNHVMMMSGMRPRKTGVPANEIYDRAARTTRTMDRATDIKVPTIIGQLNASGRQTGTVLSKEYLYGVFGRRATYRWEPAPIIPVSGHAPDNFTMDAAIAMVRQFDPSFVFVNLGNVDRFGHSDFTGTNIQLLRRFALQDTDRQVKRFVDMLKATGRWSTSMLIVLADHSMDWSLPHRLISLAGPLGADPLLAGRVEIAQNGGADLLYWTGPADRKAAAIARMRAIALAQPGVLAAHDRAATPSLKLGPEAGDVVCYARAGWRFSDPQPLANPIPGNHGHPATAPIPFFLSGGHPLVPRRVASSAHAKTVDVAPTLAEFFGIREPRLGWDGVSRL